MKFLLNRITAQKMTNLQNRRQMCNRHAIRANVNKASKQAKRGECLPCQRVVQGKRYMGKKALLARNLIALLRSQKLI